MSPGADVCEKSIRTKSEDVDNDLDFGFISIHAPRVGSDSRNRWQINVTNEFQSTLPVWGATYESIRTDTDVYISIHAPRVGSDIPVGVE